MKPAIAVTLFLTLLLSAPRPAVQPQELTLIRAFPIESKIPEEPSGIVKQGRDLFVVSDNNDSTIFRLIIEKDHARLEPAVRFKARLPDGVTKLDFEGISTDSAGNFYLVSETAYRILRVARQDGATEWIGPDLREAGRRVGLFQVSNGGLEGIAVIRPGHFFLCAERQARGILELQLRSGEPRISAWNCDHSPISSGGGIRLPDFSDLFWERGELFAMVRGAEAIVNLERAGNDFQEKAVWSIKQTLTDPRYAYEDQAFGMAEGLCLDSRNVYVVVDNNGDPRAAAPDDTRALLFIFRRPQR